MCVDVQTVIEALERTHYLNLKFSIHFLTTYGQQQPQLLLLYIKVICLPKEMATTPILGRRRLRRDFLVSGGGGASSWLSAAAAPALFVLGGAAGLYL